MSGIFTAIAITAIATGASAYQNKKSANFAKEQARKQEAAARKLQADEEKDRLQTIMRMQKRAGAVKERAGTGTTRPDILTSPLGVIGQPQTAQKTLLGQ